MTARIAGIIDIPTCDNENRYVKKLATEVGIKVDKWDGMRHRERLPASRENRMAKLSRCTTVGDEAHLQECDAWLLCKAKGRGSSGRFVWYDPRLFDPKKCNRRASRRATVGQHYVAVMTLRYVTILSSSGDG